MITTRFQTLIDGSILAQVISHIRDEFFAIVDEKSFAPGLDLKAVEWAYERAKQAAMK